MKKVSILVPAYNEAAYIVQTLQAIRRHVPCQELIVIDDGSSDQTSELAGGWADQVIRLPVNRGKGAALKTGWREARGDVLLFLDSDLRESAMHANHLLHPVKAGWCDMAIAKLPSPKRRAGFGVAKAVARHGIRYLTGFDPTAPLSGQRAVRREVLESLGRLDDGFGIEVAMTIDALRAGYRLLEVPVHFCHRESGNNLAGFLHRGRELIAISRSLGVKWREGR
ncbi:glycosyltransferase family 2 protein [Brevibacillus sp. B_LB10_24]|uniref:glycosyltransferase family 2 protein n=1 Tax=Brevibacillus sp. B_LB10_24 TaxID=3380645 RepID=UPI0038BD343A